MACCREKSHVHRLGLALVTIAHAFVLRPVLCSHRSIHSASSWLPLWQPRARLRRRRLVCLTRCVPRDVHLFSPTDRARRWARERRLRRTAHALTGIYPSRLQTEKSFQRQPIVFAGYKKLIAKKGKLTRWTRNVGLGFKTPVTAIKVRAGSYLCVAPVEAPRTTAAPLAGHVH